MRRLISTSTSTPAESSSKPIGKITYKSLKMQSGVPSSASANRPELHFALEALPPSFSQSLKSTLRLVCMRKHLTVGIRTRIASFWQHPYCYELRDHLDCELCGLLAPLDSDEAVREHVESPAHQRLLEQKQFTSRGHCLPLVGPRETRRHKAMAMNQDDGSPSMDCEEHVDLLLMRLEELANAVENASRGELTGDGADSNERLSCASDASDLSQLPPHLLERLRDSCRSSLLSSRGASVRGSTDSAAADDNDDELRPTMNFKELRQRADSTVIHGKIDSLLSWIQGKKKEEDVQKEDNEEEGAPLPSVSTRVRSWSAHSNDVSSCSSLKSVDELKADIERRLGRNSLSKMTQRSDGSLSGSSQASSTQEDLHMAGTIGLELLEQIEERDFMIQDLHDQIMERDENCRDLEKENRRLLDQLRELQENHRQTLTKVDDVEIQHADSLEQVQRMSDERRKNSERADQMKEAVDQQSRAAALIDFETASLRKDLEVSHRKTQGLEHDKEILRTQVDTLRARLQSIGHCSDISQEDRVQRERDVDSDSPCRSEDYSGGPEEILIAAKEMAQRIEDLEARLEKTHHESEQKTDKIEQLEHLRHSLSEQVAHLQAEREINARQTIEYAVNREDSMQSIELRQRLLEKDQECASLRNECVNLRSQLELATCNRKNNQKNCLEGRGSASEVLKLAEARERPDHRCHQRLTLSMPGASSKPAKEFPESKDEVPAKAWVEEVLRSAEESPPEEIFKLAEQKAKDRVQELDMELKRWRAVLADAQLCMKGQLDAEQEFEKGVEEVEKWRPLHSFFCDKQHLQRENALAEQLKEHSAKVEEILASAQEKEEHTAERVARQTKIVEDMLRMTQQMQKLATEEPALEDQRHPQRVDQDRVVTHTAPSKHLSAAYPTVSMGNVATGLGHMVNDPFFPGQQVEVLPARRDPTFNPYGLTSSDVKSSSSTSPCGFDGHTNSSPLREVAVASIEDASSQEVSHHSRTRDVDSSSVPSSTAVPSLSSTPRSCPAFSEHSNRFTVSAQTDQPYNCKQSVTAVQYSTLGSRWDRVQARRRVQLQFGNTDRSNARSISAPTIPQVPLTSLYSSQALLGPPGTAATASQPALYVCQPLQRSSPVSTPLTQSTPFSSRSPSPCASQQHTPQVASSRSCSPALSLPGTPRLIHMGAVFK